LICVCRCGYRLLAIEKRGKKKKNVEQSISKETTVHVDKDRHVS
jgi:hypothetical protein